MADGGRPSSDQFADQIRQLEREGSLLMSATNGLSDTLGLSSVPARIQDTHARSVSPSLRSLTDITAEQNTIDNMRHQLDAQTKETERFSKDVLSDSVGFHYGSSQSLLDKLDIPTARPPGRPATNHVSQSVTGVSRSEDVQYLTRVQLERELRDSRQELDTMQGQLRDTISISDKQKEHFRSTIEDLREKLQDAVVGRDMLADNKKREGAGHEATVYKLQQTVDHLEQSNRRQEETILDQKKQQDAAQRDKYVMDMALSQIRNLLLEQERRRGRPFFEGESMSTQNCTLLVRAVEKCIQELDAELEMKLKWNSQLMSELEQFKSSADDKHHYMSMEHRERMTALQSEHDKQIEVVNEHSQNSKQQAAALQDQLHNLQRQTEQQLRLKEEYVTELESRVRTHKEDLDDDKRAWKDKKEALEQACDQSQRELSLLKKEREESIRKTAILESRYDDTQRTILKLEKEAEEVKSSKLRLTEKEKDLSLKEEQLNTRLRDKDREVDELKKALDSAKSDFGTQLQLTVTSLEKEGKLIAAEENKMLSTQLISVTEKCYKLNVDCELAKSQQANLKEKYDDLKVEYNAQKEQLQSAMNRKEHLSDMVQSRTVELDRHTQERNKYQSLLEDKSREISDLKATRKKVTMQLEEREKNFLALQRQHDSLRDTAEETGKSQRELKAERDDLMRRINEKIIETEEIRHGRDNVAKKLRVREKHVQELQDDNVRMAEELRELRSEREELSKDKESMTEDLKESQYDVTNLKDEVTLLQRRLEDKEGDMGKEINKLMHKLKEADRDMRLTRKALKTREQVDGTAVKVAGKMQKAVTEKRGQIDSLQSRIRWLEDALETASKEKRTLKEESHKQAKTMKKSIEQTDRLRSEIQEYIQKNAQLREKINKMDASLEKAAVKHAASHAKLEQYEQDLARLKLKHQLEMKEVERNNYPKYTVPKETQRANLLDDDTSSCASTQVAPSDTGVNEDLRALVSEMRSVLDTHNARNTQPPSPQPSLVFPNSSTVEKFRKQQLHLEEDRRIAEELLAKYKVLQLEGDAREKLRSYDLGSSDNMRPTKLSSSNRQTRSYPHSPTLSRSRSPSRHHASRKDTVTDLLAGCHSESNMSEATLESYEDSRQRKYKSKKHDPIITDLQTQELCKRLERKIENLTKFGGDIEKENKEMSRIMRDQDKKLKKAKSHLSK